MARKKSKSHARRLRDKKINTAEERAALRIARRVVTETVPSRIYRTWFSGESTDYSGVHNHHPEGIPVLYDGVVYPISQIDKADINQPLNQSDPNDDLEDDINSGGASRGMLTEEIANVRMTDTVKVTGFTLGLRTKWPELPTSIMNGQVPANLSGDVVDDATLRYAIVGLYSPDAATPLTDENGNLDVVAPVPDAKELMLWRSFGFSALLDKDEIEASQLDSKCRKRVIMEGSMYDLFSKDRMSIKKFTKYVRLKKPISLSFHPADQTGGYSKNWQFFLVLRSSVPSYKVGQIYPYEQFAPRVSGFCKLHFTE